MNRNNDTLCHPSLAQHFDAPENYIGHFGWLCGYSADEDFLGDAAERFTRLTSAHRAYQGRIALALMLDPGNPAITVHDVPGVAHLPIKAIDSKPFRLMHAKIALLGFRHQENSSQWSLRLIISTGNWTRQTLEESLDLAWRTDVSSERLNKHDDEALQSCADLKAAHKFLMWIKELFDDRLLEFTPNHSVNETKNAKEQVNTWIISCSKIAKGQPRFFDNRNSSLLAQLPAKIKAHGNAVARNYLAMASGFYEKAETVENMNIPPEVPMLIVKTLKEQGLLTKAPEVDLYVNPHACQAIANSVQVLNKQGIIVRPAAQPPAVFGIGTPQRTLHAKLLFSANYRDNSATCNSAWAYLGSGNLTGPGFAKAMSVSAGNLEAGVLFSPDNLYWEGGKNIESWQVVTNLLPIQWKDHVDDKEEQLSCGLNMEPRDELYLAPPIAWLTWHEANGINELRPTGSLSRDIVVLDLTNNECARTETGFQWQGAQPRQVHIRWKPDKQERGADIPVIDQYGRIGATALRELDIIGAWWQLADFPVPPVEDDDREINDNGDGPRTGSATDKGHITHRINYPIRQMMELVENIAAKQTEVEEADWALWCNRLEQTLIQAKESPVIKTFRELGLNPLSPLKSAPFRPFFAITRESQAGQLYENVLTRVEEAWAIDDSMKAIGEI